MVETTLRVDPAELQTGMKDAEHVVEADIGVATGDVVIYGIGDDPERGQHISVAEGRYRTRVLHPLRAADSPLRAHLMDARCPQVLTGALITPDRTVASPPKDAAA